MTLTPKEEAVLHMMQEDPAYENYVFKKVSDLKWFYSLKEKGYFSPGKAPGPKPAEKEGYHAIPQWNVLPYLERVSEQVKVPGKEKYIDDLLGIIREVSNYRDSNGQHIDNYRTWYYFVKILLNIPNDKIPLDIIELISVWLDSKFDNTLQGADIAKKLLPKFLDSGNPEDWRKAEKIVEIITDLKRMTSEPKEEHKSIIDPYWLFESFKLYASKVGERWSANIINTLSNYFGCCL